MPTKLAHALYNARCVRVVNLTCLEVALSLSFGVTLTRNVVLDGVETRTVPPALRSQAQHCLVMIVGGRDVLVQADGAAPDGLLRARVFLDVPCPELAKVATVPPGLSQAYPEVGRIYDWAAGAGFDPATVRGVMRQVRR